MHWVLKKLEELSTLEFHELLKLRIDVFVVEQNCAYSELDGKDKQAFHLIGRNDKNEIIAYTRIFKPGDYYKEAAFGRVMIHQDFRKQGLGYKLIEETLKNIEELMGQVPVKIGAQTYLKDFYISLGFKQIGEPYIEDGIPHIYMLKNYSN